MNHTCCCQAAAQASQQHVAATATPGLCCVCWFSVVVRCSVEVCWPGVKVCCCRCTFQQGMCAASCCVQPWLLLACQHKSGSTAVRHVCMGLHQAPLVMCVQCGGAVVFGDVQLLLCVCWENSTCSCLGPERGSTGCNNIVAAWVFIHTCALLS